jgi:hypothetical protein
VIRAATIADANSIARHGYEKFKEVAVSIASPAQGEAWALEIIERGFVFVAERDGKIVGSMGLERRAWQPSGQHFMGERWIVSDTPKVFGGLIKSARAVSTRLKLPLFIGFLTRADVDAMTRLYRAAGGVQVAATFQFPPLYV